MKTYENRLDIFPTKWLNPPHRDTPWTSEDLIVSNPPYIPTKSEAAGKLSPHSGGPGGFPLR